MYKEGDIDMLVKYELELKKEDLNELLLLMEETFNKQMKFVMNMKSISIQLCNMLMNKKIVAIDSKVMNDICNYLDENPFMYMCNFDAIDNYSTKEFEKRMNQLSMENILTQKEDIDATEKFVFEQIMESRFFLNSIKERECLCEKIALVLEEQVVKAEVELMSVSEDEYWFFDKVKFFDGQFKIIAIGNFLRKKGIVDKIISSI